MSGRLQSRCLEEQYNLKSSLADDKQAAKMHTDILLHNGVSFQGVQTHHASMDVIIDLHKDLSFIQCIAQT